MAESEMFDSAARSAGDQAGVFEYDGDTGYFYLYETKGNESQKVVAAIRMLTGTPDFDEQDVVIRWDSTEIKVGLFIRGELWAVFDLGTSAKYGGNYCAGSQPAVPSEIINAFKPK